MPDPRYAAARGWVDEIIEPADTRKTLIESLEIATRHADENPSARACCKCDRTGSHGAVAAAAQFSSESL